MSEPTVSRPPRMISARWLEQQRRKLAATIPALADGTANPSYVDLAKEVAEGEAELERWQAFEAAAARLGWRVNQFPGKLADGTPLAERAGFFRQQGGRKEFATRRQVWEQVTGLRGAAS